MRRLSVTDAAQRDIQDIYWTSQDRHGLEAARRYRSLVALALDDLQQEPNRPTSKAVGIASLRLYALRIPARRLARQDAVRSPPHLVIYRYDELEVEIVRVLHAAMDLPHHLAEFDGE